MTRVVPQLYPIDGVQYGGFATASHTDGNLYLFGSDGAGGLKLARVPWESATQTSKVSSKMHFLLRKADTLCSTHIGAAQAGSRPLPLQRLLLKR